MGVARSDHEAWQRSSFWKIIWVLVSLDLKMKNEETISSQKLICFILGNQYLQLQGDPWTQGIITVS